MIMEMQNLEQNKCSKTHFTTFRNDKIVHFHMETTKCTSKVRSVPIEASLKFAAKRSKTK